MAELDYIAASKLGQKEYRACRARGVYPYLPSLDSFVSQEQLTQGEDLGIEQVPVELFAGTKTEGRVHAFARDFMPLLDAKSEFGQKWVRLSDAHLSEGIRDPVKAYEFLNRYYVEEGNKRVSVLKYFGAVTVAAHVIRVRPRQDGSREVERYNAFTRFHRASRVNFLEFSRPEAYDELQALMGKAPDEGWTQEDQRWLSARYYRFKSAYEASAARPVSTADAFLVYLRFYGKKEEPPRLKEAIARISEEIALQAEERPIDIRTDPQEKKPGLLDRVFIGENKPMKVAFVYDGTPETSGWTLGHEMGRRNVEEVFGGTVRTTAYPDAMTEDPETVLRRAVAEGNQVIFTTSPRLLPASLSVAVEHPEITILNCSLNTSHRYIRTYYARIYEAKFVIGAIAGTLAGSGPIGYVCDYPIYGQVAGINAFALGVQMVNPQTKVILEWSSEQREQSAEERLVARGVRLASIQDMAKLQDVGTGSFGLSILTDGKRVQLARPVWQWGVYYEELLRRIRDRSFRSEYESSRKALNYYWGMPAGVVRVECGDSLPDGPRKLAELLQDGIRSRTCNPFRGPLYDQSGRKIDRPDRAISLEEIIQMDWLLENVEGRIPAYAELNDKAKSTVDQVGVNLSQKEKKNV